MSKAVKCPSCRMKGKTNGEDYALVATHRGRPVVQCFWCDSQIHLPRFHRPVLIDVEPMFEAVFEFKRAVDYDSLVSLMAMDEDLTERSPHSLFAERTATGTSILDDVDTAAAAGAILEDYEPGAAEASTETESSTETDVLEPAAYEAQPQVREPEPYPIDPRIHNLLQLANHVGWTHPVTNSRYQPEFMDIKLPPRRPMTQRQETWHEFRMMMKYFQLNGGGKEQKQLEVAARRVRMAQAKQLRRHQRRLRLDLRKFEAGEAI
ncbi:MAG: hypothetical protein WD602_07665 [Actinomycetota bacterium]